MMSRTKKIDNYLNRIINKTGRGIPYGTFTIISNKFKVSRELVRFRAKTMGLHVEHKTVYCQFCQNIFRPKNHDDLFCSRICSNEFRFYKNHKLVHCEVCGSGILITQGLMRGKKNKNFYCDHKCYAKSKYLKNLGKYLKKLHGKDYYKILSIKGNQAQKSIRTI